MQLEKMTAQVRPRKPWEAVDLVWVHSDRIAWPVGFDFVLIDPGNLPVFGLGHEVPFVRDAGAVALRRAPQRDGGCEVERDPDSPATGRGAQREEKLNRKAGSTPPTVRTDLPPCPRSEARSA